MPRTLLNSCRLTLMGKNCTGLTILIFLRRNSTPSNESRMNNNNSMKKQVSFASEVSVRTALSLEDYRRIEIEACWWTRTDYREIQNACIKQVAKMEQGHIFKDKKYCARGLERHTSIGSMTRSQNKNLAYYAVLEEQDYQLANNLPYDDESIAYQYSQISASCQLWANATALKDQRNAEDVWDDESMTYSKLLPMNVPRHAVPIRQEVIQIAARSA